MNGEKIYYELRNHYEFAKTRGLVGFRESSTEPVTKFLKKRFRLIWRKRFHIVELKFRICDKYGLCLKTASNFEFRRYEHSLMQFKKEGNRNDRCSDLTQSKKVCFRNCLLCLLPFIQLYRFLTEAFGNGIKYDTHLLGAQTLVFDSAACLYTSNDAPDLINIAFVPQFQLRGRLLGIIRDTKLCLREHFEFSQRVMG